MQQTKHPASVHRCKLCKSPLLQSNAKVCHVCQRHQGPIIRWFNAYAVVIGVVLSFAGAIFAGYSAHQAGQEAASAKEALEAALTAGSEAKSASKQAHQAKIQADLNGLFAQIGDLNQAYSRAVNPACVKIWLRLHSEDPVEKKQALDAYWAGCGTGSLQYYIGSVSLLDSLKRLEPQWPSEFETINFGALRNAQPSSVSESICKSIGTAVTYMPSMRDVFRLNDEHGSHVFDRKFVTNRIDLAWLESRCGEKAASKFDTTLN